MPQPRLLLDGVPASSGEGPGPRLLPGLLSGAGIFTTLRMRTGVAVFWPDHFRRLADGAAVLGVPLVPEERLQREIDSAAEGLPDARVRIALVADGSGGAVRVVSAEAYEPPAAPWRLRLVASGPIEAPVAVKSISRLRYVLARRAAVPCDDALLFSGDGSLLEATVANLFFVEGDTLVTPPATAPLLPGIARARVLAAAAELGFRSKERRIGPEEARRAEACFLTNALFVAHPVGEIEGLGEFSEGEVAWQLRERLLAGAGGPPGAPP